MNPPIENGGYVTRAEMGAHLDRLETIVTSHNDRLEQNISRLEDVVGQVVERQKIPGKLAAKLGAPLVDKIATLGAAGLAGWLASKIGG